MDNSNFIPPVLFPLLQDRVLTTIKSLLLLLMLLLYLVISIPLYSQAQQIPAITSFNITATNTYTALNGTLGWEFQVNNDITITQPSSSKVIVSVLLFTEYVKVTASSP